MRKHKLRNHKSESFGAISLAQVETSLATESALELERKPKPKASVKKPSNPEKLKLVQLNDQKPAKHKGKPKARSLLQLSQHLSDIDLQEDIATIMKPTPKVSEEVH